MNTPLKNILRTIALTGSVLAVTSLSAYSAEYVSVTKDGVNVRTGPSTSNPVYMELFEGYPLKVVDKKGDWLKVTDFEDDSGWIYSPLIEKRDTVIVNASSRANMRSGPGTGNAVVATLERGVVLELLERRQDWVKVKHASGTEGWIYASLVWP